MPWTIKTGGMKSTKSGTNSTSLKNKKSNSKSGRPKSLNKEQLEKLMELYYSRPVSIRTLAKMFGISRMTVWRIVNSVETVTVKRPVCNGGVLYD